LKRLLTTLIIISIIVAGPLTLNALVNKSHGLDTRVLKIVTSDTGTNTTSLGDDGEPMPLGGLGFTVNVTLTGATNRLMTYQIAIKYNRTAINCTAAWIDKTDQSFVFYQKKDHVIVTVDAQIDRDIGYVWSGASLVEGGDYVNVTSGLLLQANFTALRKGNYSLTIIPDGDLEYPDDSFLLDDSYPNQLDMPFTAEDLTISAFCGPSTPVAQFSWQPVNPMPSQGVAFDGRRSYDPYGNVTQYLWNFGDGTEENATAQIAHEFASAGSYIVNLTVMNDFALNPAYSYSNSVLNEVQVGVLPNANFTLEPAQPRELTEITFDASQSSATDASIATYSWNFGDGANDTTDSATITHVFANKGVYDVSLTVLDSHGLHSSITTTIQVGGIPLAAFTFSPSNPDVGQVVTFNATQSRASEQGDTIVSYVWDFGDGNITQVNASTPNAATPQYSYLEDGNYTVGLTVYDNNGLFDSNVQILIVGHESPDYTTYIVIGVIVALFLIAGLVVFWIRSRPQRHTPQPKKPPKK
jgi:PKD repeat protein